MELIGLSGATLNTARNNESGSGGTSTAGIALLVENNGSNYAQTESWNGSAWTEQNDLNTARNFLWRSGGTQPSALAWVEVLILVNCYRNIGMDLLGQKWQI